MSRVGWWGKVDAAQPLWRMHCYPSSPVNLRHLRFGDAVLCRYAQVLAMTECQDGMLHGGLSEFHVGGTPNLEF